MVRRLAIGGLTGLALTLLPSFAAAQSSDARDRLQAGNQRPRPAPDFLFKEPLGTVGVKGSWIFARAGSDLFDFLTEQLTIDDGAFNAPAFAADVGVTITPQLDVVGGFQFSRATTSSEYRDFVDNNFLPIEQQTGLKEIDVSGSLRWALKPRGRAVSRLAWVPARLMPYLGAGAGVLWYEFKQSGDFVDFVDLSVFTDQFRSTGWTPSAHVFGGADIHLYKRLYVSLEGRYLWARGKLGPDFVDFDPIDLAGFRMAAGVNVVY